MHVQPAKTPPPSSQSTSTPTDQHRPSPTSGHPLPFLLAVILTPARPAVILIPCWRSSCTLLLAVIFTPARTAVILHPCWGWQSTSPFPIQRSNSTIPSATGHIHPCLPSGHPLTLLLAAIFSPARTAVILYPSCWHSYSPLHKLRSSATPPAGWRSYSSHQTHKSTQDLHIFKFFLLFFPLRLFVYPLYTW